MQVFKELEQRSQEWYELRLGTITCSKAKGILKPSYISIADLIASEIMTGQEDEVYVNDSMQWGIDNEYPAKQAYARETFTEGYDVGFCKSESKEYLGLSPDWLIGETKALEIKCPKSKTHIRYIREDVLPKEYVEQVVHYFVVHDQLKELDFVSYDPRNKVKSLWIKTVKREDLSKEIEKASNRYDEIWNEVKRILTINEKSDGKFKSKGD